MQSPYPCFISSKVSLTIIRSTYQKRINAEQYLWCEVQQSKRIKGPVLEQYIKERCAVQYSGIYNSLVVGEPVWEAQRIRFTLDELKEQVNHLIPRLVLHTVD